MVKHHYHQGFLKTHIPFTLSFSLFLSLSLSFSLTIRLYRPCHFVSCLDGTQSHMADV